MEEQEDSREHPLPQDTDDVEIELQGPAVPTTGDEAEQILEVTLENEPEEGGELPALSPLDAAVAGTDAPWVDVPAVCAQTDQAFVVRFQERKPGQYVVVGTRPQPPGSRGPETGLGEAVSGQFSLNEYPGCPVCGSPGLIECDACQTVTCGHSARQTKQGLVTRCPNCHREGKLAPSGTAVMVPTEPRGKKGKL